MKAGRRYESWTNGYFFPWRGPEYIYTTTVAQEIAKQPYRPNVYCEYNSKDAKKEANLAGHGLPNKKLKARSRTDIIINGKDDVPRHAIEVKRRVRRIGQVDKDINRLADLVASKNTTTIRSGISLFFLCEWAASRSEAKEKLENYRFLIPDARDALKSRRLNYRVNLVKADKIKIYEDGRELHWAWTSAALVVRPASSE